MNPKNIFKVLTLSFSPEYQFESIISAKEGKFASYLEAIIKDAISANLLVESFETLNFEKSSVFPDVCIYN